MVCAERRCSLTETLDLDGAGISSALSERAGNVSARGIENHIQRPCVLAEERKQRRWQNHSAGNPVFPVLTSEK